jgi:hypothetical protein
MTARTGVVVVEPGNGVEPKQPTDIREPPIDGAAESRRQSRLDPAGKPELNQALSEPPIKRTIRRITERVRNKQRANGKDGGEDSEPSKLAHPPPPLPSPVARARPPESKDWTGLASSRLVLAFLATHAVPVQCLNRG